MTKKKPVKQKVQFCAILTYDQFPFMVVHKVLSVADNGNLEFSRGSFRTASSLISLFPIEKYKEIEDAIYDIKEEYKKIQEETRGRLLAKVVKKYPAIKSRLLTEYSERYPELKG